MPRRRAVEDPVSHERWLVSYADFITLLFAFFVVMYSISQVNEGKYKVLSETLTQAFTASGKDAVQTEPELTLDPFQVGEQARSNPLNVIELEAPVVERDGGEGDARQRGVPGEEGGLPDDFEQLSEQVAAAFGNLMDSDMISLRGNEEWLEVELNSSLLFDSGEARLNSSALELLGGIAELLKGSDHPIRVEGFTDNIPINTPRFPSNWELSTARAAAVVQLFMEEGITPARLAAIGYGEYQPVASNASPEGRARNRRVVLMISKSGALRPELPQLTELAAVAAPAGGSETQAPALPADAATAADEATAGEQPDTADTPEQPAATEGEAGGIEGVRTIELEDGGLLFTRDEEEPAR